MVPSTQRRVRVEKIKAPSRVAREIRQQRFPAPEQARCYFVVVVVVVVPSAFFFVCFLALCERLLVFLVSVVVVPFGLCVSVFVVVLEDDFLSVWAAVMNVAEPIARDAPRISVVSLFILDFSPRGRSFAS
jgi:hypothetical protein